MAALDDTPPPLVTNRSPSPPTTTITVAAAPSSPPSATREMLSPSSNSPASPTIPTHRALSPAVATRSLSVPASPSANCTSPTVSTNTIAMNNTASTPTPVSSGTNHNTPPTKKVLERNQACLGCRQRKRKCDGGKPSCGACERLDRLCVYTHNAVTKIHSSSHYRETSSVTSSNRPSSGPRPSTAHDSPAAMRRNSATPSLAVPTVHRPASNTPAKIGGGGGGAGGGGGGGGAGFTPVNADPSGVPSARPSPPNVAPSRLSPHLSNGNNIAANPRKRSFSSLDSSPGIGGRVIGGGSHVEFDATRFALQFLQASPFVRFGLMDIPHVSAVDEPVSSEEMPGLTDDGLPSVKLMQELFTLFFDKWHSILPCLYKQRVMAEINPGGSLAQPNTLTFAILALSGYLHPDVGVKAASHKWADLGKAHFDHAVAEGQYEMQLVQGGIYLCLRMFGLGQMSQMWVFLASIWRICLPLGFHQIDSNSSSAYRGFLPDPRSELEIEERRRTVWSVYILDRLVSSAVPWSMCVVDSEFCVNFPVSEEVFQNGSMENVEHMIIDPFPTNIEYLLPLTMASTNAPPRDAYQQLCKLAVLLGRILSYTRSTNRSITEFETLNDTLTRLLLSTPKPYRTLSGVPSSELPTVLLLACVTHACTIFLHTDGGGEGEGPGAAAAENIVSLVRKVSSTLGPDDDKVLANPLLSPVLLLAARILCWRCYTQGNAEFSAIRSKIEILLGALTRMEELWPKLAGTMKNIICEDGKRDPMVV